MCIAQCIGHTFVHIHILFTSHYHLVNCQLLHLNLHKNLMYNQIVFLT